MDRPDSRDKRTLKVLVAMSGGVDSAVAAYLLLRAGHTVAGATMKLFCYDSEDAPVRPCCDMEAIREARRSAEKLGIPHTVIDMEESFGRTVIDDFIREYSSARTPNPCIRCNTYVKFGPLLEKATRMGYDAVATGHYVRRQRVGPSQDEWGLFRAADREKDQTYVLWGLRRDALDRCLFPLGDLRKGVVRRVARRIGLRSWDRAESQDICFVPTGDPVEFLTEHLDEDHPLRRPGPVRHLDGRQLGEHDGLLGYTIGQRRGIRASDRERLYVVRLDPPTATLWVGPRPATFSHGLLASGVNLLASPSLLTGAGVVAKIRYRQEGLDCRVELLDEGRWEIRFEQPVSAVAPGQSVVLYRGDQLLGGGWIEQAIPDFVPEAGGSP